jgi:LmbE family N-acetylglucosaminyl deacetylase
MKFMSYLLSLLLVLSFLPFSGVVHSEEHDVELWNAVKPLDTTVTFLNTGAHPDDERSDFLAYLSRGLGVKTSSLIANRGEGGQNEIGQELGNGLGIIRSREMIEAAKITGVKAYHLSETTSDPIYDFGFSKTPEETLEKWGEELTYERLIRFIRTYEPDILMPSFRDSDSQHGHHRSITILSQRAFEDAANPDIFPEQLEEGLSVWQVKKFYLPAESEDTATTSIEIGDYDPIYEMSYPQIGEESRYMHKSQGMGNDIGVAPRQTHLELEESSVETTGTDELFEGIPYDFKEWAEEMPKGEKSLKVHYTKFQKSLEGIISSYPDRGETFGKAQKALKEVERLEKKTEKSKLDEQVKKDLLHKISLKKEQLNTVSFVASDLSVDASAETTVLTKGQDVQVKVQLANQGEEKLKKAEVRLVTPEGWVVVNDGKSVDLKPGEEREVVFDVKVPSDADYYHAYEEPAIQAKISFEAAGSKTTHIQNLNGTIAVLPDVGITLNPEDIVVNRADVQDEIPVVAKVKNYRDGATSSQISLTVPEGWEVSPQEVTVQFDESQEEKDVSFTLSPPEGIGEGNFEVGAQAVVGGQTFSSTVQEISYDHIGTFYYLYDSKVNGVAFELLTPENLKVGYIESGFDKVADYLRNVGMDITSLTEDDLASGDLGQYDTIVTGIRAYLSREDLVENNPRLKEYVENGGHLVVQYHKPNDGWDKETTAPYPLTIGNPSIRWRVTDENAAVTVLQPESPLFNYPNTITGADWDNWVQERGLYYPMAWDDRYETFVRMADPNEEPFDGGILMAEYGQGTYLYTNLVFYRQIQGGVPGGYRIFTNLLSYGQN